MDQTHRQEGSLNDVEHVIMFMQENRSFDHYYGTLSGVRGFDDARREHGRNVFYQPDPQNPDGYVLPFRLDTFTTSGARGAGLSNAWYPTHACVGMAGRWTTGSRGNAWPRAR
jgi:phospholipase C